MHDVIVIGAGVAGMTAALNVLRGGKSVLVLESESFGGQVSFSPRVENMPSIKQISGSEFADNLFEQITDLGADVELEKVLKVEKQEDKTFVVTTDYGTHTAKAVILATGVKHRHIGVERELDLVGHGVSYCAVCDGAFYEGEEVALIGDATAALQYSLLLSNYCKKVYVLTLFDKFFADKILVDRLRQRDNVEIHHNLSLQEFLGEEELTGIRLKNTKDGTDFMVRCKGCFICIGQVPDNKAFENIVDLDRAGYIVSDESCTTKTDGVFVAGDCRTKKMRQITTAAADGATAAFLVNNYIDTL